MSENLEATEERARLSFDLDDELENEETIHERVQKISTESGFLARAAQISSDIKPPQASAKPEASPPPARRARYKTGRTYPFNTRIKPETYEAICNLADSATENEGRPVSMAEIIERAIDLLQEKSEPSLHNYA